SACASIPAEVESQPRSPSSSKRRQPCRPNWTAAAGSPACNSTLTDVCPVQREVEASAAVRELGAQPGEDRPCLLEAAGHRESHCAVLRQIGITHPAQLLLVDPREQFRDRGRTEHAGGAERRQGPELVVRQAGSPGVDERTFG